jgi:hypothetical protein
MTGMWSGGGLPASGGYSFFDVWDPFTLQSVNSYALTAGLRTIQLVDGNGTILASTQVNLPVGVFNINLGFYVPAGTGYSLRCLENDLFRNNNGVSYPYAIGSVGELTGSLNGGSYYYYFYDWVIAPDALYCPSARIPATVEINVGIEETGTGFQLSIYPNPTSSDFSIELPSGFSTGVLSVIDSRGSVVEERQISGVQEVVQVTDLSLESGVYTVRLIQNGQNYVSDLIIID